MRLGILQFFTEVLDLSLKTNSWQSTLICKSTASKGSRRIPLTRAGSNSHRLSGACCSLNRPQPRRAGPYRRTLRTSQHLGNETGRPCIAVADANLFGRENDSKGQARIHACRQRWQTGQVLRSRTGERSDRQHQPSCPRRRHPAGFRRAQVLQGGNTRSRRSVVAQAAIRRAAGIWPPTASLE